MEGRRDEFAKLRLMQEISHLLRCIQMEIGHMKSILNQECYQTTQKAMNHVDEKEDYKKTVDDGDESTQECPLLQDFVSVEMQEEKAPLLIIVTQEDEDSAAFNNNAKEEEDPLIETFQEEDEELQNTVKNKDDQKKQERPNHNDEKDEYEEAGGDYDYKKAQEDDVKQGIPTVQNSLFLTRVPDVMVNGNMIPTKTETETKNWMIELEMEEIEHGKMKDCGLQDEVEGMKIRMDSEAEATKKKKDANRGHVEMYMKDFVTVAEIVGSMVCHGKSNLGGIPVIPSKPTINHKTREDANQDVLMQRNYTVSTSSHLNQAVKAFDFQKDTGHHETEDEDDDPELKTKLSSSSWFLVLSSCKETPMLANLSSEDYYNPIFNGGNTASYPSKTMLSHKFEQDRQIYQEWCWSKKEESNVNCRGIPMASEKETENNVRMLPAKDTFEKAAKDVFEKIEKVGEGPYGKVYRATDKSTLHEDEEGILSITQRVLSRDSHVVRLMDVKQAQNKEGKTVLYLVLEDMVDTNAKKFICSFHQTRENIPAQTVSPWKLRLWDGSLVYDSDSNKTAEVVVEDVSLFVAVGWGTARSWDLWHLDSCTETSMALGLNVLAFVHLFKQLFSTALVLTKKHDWAWCSIDMGLWHYDSSTNVWATMNWDSGPEFSNFLQPPKKMFNFYGAISFCSL